MGEQESLITGWHQNVTFPDSQRMLEQLEGFPWGCGLHKKVV